MQKTIYKFLQAHRKVFLYSLDISIITFAWVAANVLTGSIETPRFLFVLPFIIAAKILIFNVFGLYRALLRYASFHFAINIIKATCVSALLYPLILFFSPYPLPLDLFIIDFELTLSFIGAGRFFPRYYYETFLQEPEGGEKRVLIYGAGEVGDSVARSFLRQRKDFLSIGFIDDDEKKLGRKVHNLPILGNRNDLGKIIKKYHINELIVAISNYPAEWLRNILRECRSYHIPCRLVPLMPGMADQEISIKNIDITDLLKRNPQDLDEKQIDRFLRGKKILITGAAGSIGSELVYQALRFRPTRMILVDNSEFGLYKIKEKLQEVLSKKPDERKELVRYALQDLCDGEAIENLVREEKPDIIFHAAAYKHVPLIEMNPFIGVKNNILGTIHIANAANKFGVEKVVLISTDKAVRPTNVMGATKRICELYIQNLNLRSKTEYIAVRFGNVLGSSGSVIPKFIKQIKNGGPITVTHPEVVRYFMLTQEAVQLAMQAASIGHGGEIFILNMGNPVKIKEMAEDLIFLSGKEPYRDIDIQFIGLRPGEKLFEELLIDETEKKTQYENITIGKMTFIDWTTLQAKVNALLTATQSNDRDKVLVCLNDLVPEFNHIDLPQTQSNVVKIA